MVEVALVVVIVSLLTCAHFVQICARELRQIRGVLARQDLASDSGAIMWIGGDSGSSRHFPLEPVFGGLSL